MVLEAPARNTAHDGEEHGDIAQCPVIRMLPPKLQQASSSSPHLWQYLHQTPVEKIGIPQYHETLDRELGDTQNPNVIYPVSDDVYIHVSPDPGGGRNNYVPVEPGMGQDLAPYLEEIEMRLIDLVDEHE